MSVVLAQAAYLPAAQCFALLPLVGGIARTGSAAGALLDYDFDRQAAVLISTRPYSRGQEVRLFDGRPSGEVFLATGSLEPSNPADCLTLPAALVPADRLYSMKKEVLESVGLPDCSISYLPRPYCHPALGVPSLGAIDRCSTVCKNYF